MTQANNTKYKYNKFGELVKQTTDGISQSYKYNILGNRSEYLLENSGDVEMRISYNYDNAGRLSGVVSHLGEQSYTYDNANRLIKSTNATSGIGEQYSYYPSGNIKTQRQYSGQGIADEVNYQYNRNGFRTSEKGLTVDKKYSYDNQNRLYEELDGELLKVYNYDDFGNIRNIRSFVGNIGSIINYSYDGNNRLVARYIDGEKTEYTYDRQGNLTSVKNAVEETYYQYNGFNRLAKVIGDNLIAEYAYDHTGLRTSKKVNGVYTQLVNDGQDVV